MVLAAAVAGAAVVGARRRCCASRSGISESVTTLLLNYVALDLMFFLIYDRWKDQAGSGQPTTRAAARRREHLPLIGSGRVHVGHPHRARPRRWSSAWSSRCTTWGFRLRVVGGNAEAARRSGLKVGVLLLVGDGRRRGARRPRRADPARRRRVQAPLRASSPATATSASSPPGSAATSPSYVVLAAARARRPS